ncbi:MAG: hypothetical protein QGH42_13505 [Kiritimatiellia bacterium]|jgi:hypothetical protein|nr:hypothetical protein [Kiritimatiellia bacterium]MDP7025241.1 hypothetical protein [Kiritimatiellia bacterium]
MSSRFTLERGQWYAAEILGEEFGGKIRSHTRIQVYEVKPLGGRKFELSFYHENYPEGVRDKRYTLQTIELTRLIR